MQLDHLVVAVRDLDAARDAFEEAYGLASIEGGRHPRWGTANRIIPLGDAYVELIALVDRSAAPADPFCRRLESASTDAGALVAWAVRTDELDTVAARLGLRIEPGTRAGADGSVVRWRMAGLERALVEPTLPFLIERAPGSVQPGRAAAAVGRLETVTLAGSAERLVDWLGVSDLPVTLVPGEPAILEARVTTAAGRTVEIGG